MRLLLLFALIDLISGLHLHVGRTARSVNDGDHGAADQYLKKFGYMSEFNSFKSPSEVEETRTKSLKAFQKFYKLPETGKLDADTVNIMNMPRCGVPDVRLTDNGVAQFSLGSKWTKKSLTWRLNNFTPDLSNAVVRTEITRAFRLWSDVADLSFTEVTSSGSVDIDVSFESGAHGDGYPFDQQFGVLAHAFFPQVGTTHFDEAETWVANTTGIDLFIVAAHEFGHALGLDHSNVNGALMFPTYAGYVPNYQLHPDDIAGIRAHYGAAVQPTTQAPTQAPTNAPTAAPTNAPTPAPTNAPTPAPTNAPTQAPTSAPTQAPTNAPTNAPTQAPTNAPTQAPTNAPTQAPTNAPTQSPTNAPTRPRICNTIFNAATMTNSGQIMAFVGRRYVLIMDDVEGLVRVARTRRLFRGAPRRPSAVFSIPSTGNIYFLRGNRIYEFNSDGRRLRRFWIRGARRSVPESPRAAFAVNENEIYILGNTKVWTLDLTTRRVVANSHRLISEKFPGIPNRLDSALMFDDETLYFFKGNQYYLYDTQDQITWDGPLDASSQFIKRQCQL